MRILLRTILLTLLTITCCQTLRAQQEAPYDSLSRYTPQQLMDMGRKSFELRQQHQALACFVLVKERLKNSDSNEEIHLYIRALNNIACVLRYFYFDYVNAYENLTQAYDLCEQHDYQEFKPVIMVNLGDLINDYSNSYHSAALEQQAHDIFDECMRNAVEEKNWELMTTAFFNLANQNYTLPLEDYRIIFSKDIPDSTPDIGYIRLQYQGLALMQQGKTAEAREHFQRQLAAITSPWEPQRDTLATYMSIAHTYQMEQDYANETEYLQRAYKMTRDNSVNDHAVNILKLLAESYQRQGNSERREYYWRLYLEQKEETDASRLANVGELNYIYQLKKEEENSKRMAERQRQQTLLFIAIITVLVLAGAAVTLISRKNRQLYLRTKALYDKNRQMLQMERDAQALRQIEYADQKYRRSNLSVEQKEALVFRIEQVLNSDEVCQPDFNLGKLAKLVESNTTYVSQVINEHYGISFSNVMSAYRVREACRRINDETAQYSQITIEAIAMAVGFKSRTSFINAFKREVGLTPSEYLRLALKKEA